jgi:hypothetical protein
MDDLPHIVDTPTKFSNVVYEEDEALKNKVLAYLNQKRFR